MIGTIFNDNKEIDLWKEIPRELPLEQLLLRR
jgi:hypothetical protein